MLKEKIKDFGRRAGCKADSLPIDRLPALCDHLNLHLLVIDHDMSFHFKFLEIVNKKAQVYLATSKGFLDEEKFVEWWFTPLSQLNKFK